MTGTRRWRNSEKSPEQSTAIVDYRAEVQQAGIPVDALTDEQCRAVYDTLSRFKQEGKTASASSPRPSTTSSVVLRKTFTHCRFCSKVRVSTEQYEITHPVGHTPQPDPLNVWINACEPCQTLLQHIPHDTLLAAAVTSPHGRKIINEHLRESRQGHPQQPQLPLTHTPGATSRAILSNSLPKDSPLDSVNPISTEVQISDFLAGSDLDRAHAIPDNAKLAEWGLRNGWKVTSFGNLTLTLGDKQYRLHIKKRVLRLDVKLGDRWTTILSGQRTKVFLTPTQLGGLTRHTGIIRATNGSPDTHDRATDSAIDKGEHTIGRVPSKFGSYTSDELKKVR